MRPQPPLLLRASVLLALTTEGVATGSDIGTLASVPVDNWTLVASEDIEQFVRRDSPMRYHWQDTHTCLLPHTNIRPSNATCLFVDATAPIFGSRTATSGRLVMMYTRLAAYKSNVSSREAYSSWCWGPMLEKTANGQYGAAKRLKVDDAESEQRAELFEQIQKMSGYWVSDGRSVNDRVHVPRWSGRAGCLVLASTLSVTIDSDQSRPLVWSRDGRGKTVEDGLHTSRVPVGCAEYCCDDVRHSAVDPDRHDCLSACTHASSHRPSLYGDPLAHPPAWYGDPLTHPAAWYGEQSSADKTVGSVDSHRPSWYGEHSSADKTVDSVDSHLGLGLSRSSHGLPLWGVFFVLAVVLTVMHYDRTDTVAGPCLSLLYFVQLLGLVCDEGYLHWAHDSKKFTIEAFEVFGLTYVQRWCVAMLTPGMIILGHYAFAGAWIFIWTECRVGALFGRLPKQPHDWGETKRSLIRPLLLYMLVGYTFLSGISMEPIVCKAEFGMRARVVAAPSIPCDWDDDTVLDPIVKFNYRMLACMSITCCVAYGIGVPIACGLFLYARRDQIDSQKFAETFGILVTRMKTSCYLWESVIFLRRLALVVTLGVSDDATVVSTSLTGIFILTAAYALHLEIMPFNNSDANYVEALTLCASLLVLVGKLATLQDDTAGLMQLVHSLNSVMIAWSILIVFRRIIALYHGSLRAGQLDKLSSVELNRQQMSDLEERLQTLQSKEVSQQISDLTEHLQNSKLLTKEVSQDAAVITPILAAVITTLPLSNESEREKLLSALPGGLRTHVCNSQQIYELLPHGFVFPYGHRAYTLKIDLDRQYKDEECLLALHKHGDNEWQILNEPVKLSTDGKQAIVIVRRFSYVALLEGAAAVAGTLALGSSSTSRQVHVAAAGGILLGFAINHLSTLGLHTEPYMTCIDRPYVQLEIREAQRCEKNIITVYEEDRRRQGYFDFALARPKYNETQWRSLLEIDAITYRHQTDEAEAMINRIIARATAMPANFAAVTTTTVAPRNQPGRWDFFLSHGQAAAGAQAQVLCLKLRARQKPDGSKYTVWYDNEMQDRSTEAMMEGVAHAQNLLLFLSGDPNLG